MPLKKNIKILLVGLNKYSRSWYRLNACKADVLTFKEFLEQYHDSQKYNLEIKTLIDHEATRKNVINNFLDHLGTLDNGDIGLFYFSGHGSRSQALKEFWHTTTDKKHESIICYDSKSTGGFNLLDIELSWLIWKVTQGKKVQFTTILDSCHSGSGTRNQMELAEGVKKKTDSKVEDQRTWKDYLGAADYISNLNLDLKSVKTRVGRHLLLAACHKNEFANEKIIDNKYRGVFTYSLIEVLQKANSDISYQHLIEATHAKVQNHVYNQTPRLEFTHAEDIALPFLGGLLKKKPKSYLVSYHYKKGWTVDFGSIDGLVKNDREESIKLQLFSESGSILQKDNPIKEVFVDKVYSTFSTLKSFDYKATKECFRAIPAYPIFPPMAIAFEASSNSKALDHIQLALQDKNSSLLKWSNDIDKVKYKILVDHDSYIIDSKDLPFLLTFRGLESAKQVLNSLEVIAQWHRIKALSNPATLIHREELAFEFNEILAINDKFEIVDHHLVADFPLTSSSSLNSEAPICILKGAKPAFQLKIKNPKTDKSRALWYSVLFLGSDFSIENKLLPSELLQPGEEAALKIFDEAHQVFTEIINLHIEDAYSRNNISSIKEHFKVIISTEEIVTNKWNQKGLLTDQGLRGVVDSEKRLEFTAPDWTVVDFTIQIGE